jgi:hypothetical protein
MLACPHACPPAHLLLPVKSRLILLTCLAAAAAQGAVRHQPSLPTRSISHHSSALSHHRLLLFLHACMPGCLPACTSVTTCQLTACLPCCCCCYCSGSCQAPAKPPHT